MLDDEALSPTTKEGRVTRQVPVDGKTEQGEVTAGNQNKHYKESFFEDDPPARQQSWYKSTHQPREVGQKQNPN